jgi:hypothetical protein
LLRNNQQTNTHTHTKRERETQKEGKKAAMELWVSLLLFFFVFFFFTSSSSIHAAVDDLPGWMGEM